MRIFKTRWFHRWAERERLTDTSLVRAVGDLGSGLVDANLGGNLFKKRIAVQGVGKRAGLRILLASRNQERVIFIYGFRKSQKANINDRELRALKLLATELLSYGTHELALALKYGALVEVQNGE